MNVVINHCILWQSGLFTRNRTGSKLNFLSKIYPGVYCACGSDGKGRYLKEDFFPLCNREGSPYFNG